MHMFRSLLFSLLAIIVTVSVCACAGNTFDSASTGEVSEIPDLPENIEYDSEGVPIINV